MSLKWHNYRIGSVFTEHTKRCYIRDCLHGIPGIGMMDVEGEFFENKDFTGVTEYIFPFP